MDKYSKTKQIWITVLGGWFGLHCYLNKQYLKGIIYTLTIGVFEIGWFIDIYKVCRKKNNDIETTDNPNNNFNSKSDNSIAIQNLQIRATDFNRILTDVQCGFKNLDPYLSRYKLLLEMYHEMEKINNDNNLSLLTYTSDELYNTFNTELNKFIKNKILVMLDTHSIDQDENKSLKRDLMKIRKQIIEGKHQYPEFSNLLQELQFQLENEINKL